MHAKILAPGDVMITGGFIIPLAATSNLHD